MNDLTLAEFLAARLGEDEAQNREVHEARVCSGCSDGWEAGFDPERCDCGYPARVFREVEAGRKILTRYEFSCRQAEINTGTERDAWEKIAGALERDVLDLAAVYSDHPDYREEWKP